LKTGIDGIFGKLSVGIGSLIVGNAGNPGMSRSIWKTGI
jgi:hypothetical protein